MTHASHRGSLVREAITPLYTRRTAFGTALSFRDKMENVLA
ncbi:hypothetical protein N8Z77_06750 [Planktomarina sp.]|nr:hypothetical protein [Planktomarina sp.]